MEKVNEQQKRLLQQALDMLEEQALHIEAPMLPAGEELLNRMRAALSQQAEPAGAQTEQKLDGEAVEIVASAIDGPCRDVETIDDMAQIICGHLAGAGFLRVRKSEAANFAAPIADAMCRFGLGRDDAEALGAELAIALIPRLAQWDEDHHAAPIAQTAPTPWQEATGRAAFKNFHRGLCERFGYTHDEEFWWRDLISLEEHIAKLSAPERVSVPVELLERCVERWACCSMAQTPGAEDAWSELRALLASHQRGEV